ncbi:MAG: hypothetical protein JNM31_12925 [Flavobacteriales bacterium]|nr:hypothetical protein [Flavobacteriales bacterium]
MRPLLILSTLTLLLAACAGQRKQLESAARYEQEGMMQQAYDRYADLYARRAGNTEAHVGMQRTAQVLFDRLQDEAGRLYLTGDFMAGEKARNEASAFRDRMTAKRLELRWDPLLEQRRTAARTAYAEQLYLQADSAFRNDRFSECDDITERILKLMPDHRNAKHLQQLARLEPRYRLGVRAFELGLYRDAFLRLNEVADKDPAYKDVWKRLQEAREKASWTISFVPLVNQMLYIGNPLLIMSSNSLELALAASVRQAILDLKDPLVILVDRENTAELLAEQERGMQGVYDDAYAVKAGRLLGARFVLTGRILRYDDAFAKQIEVQVQLVDAETGRIHIAETIRVNKQELSGRGNIRAQLMDRAALRIARQLAEFDPYRR